MTIWLMDAKEVDKIEAVLNREIDADTAEKIQAVEHQIKTPAMSESGIGQIRVSGVLLANPSPMLDFFGVDYTAYSDIDKQIEMVESDDRVKGVDFDISSGGGMVQGMYHTMGLISEMKKPTVTRGRGMIASAAYMIASQTDHIEGEDDLTMFGSVGVVTGGYVDKDVVEVTNTASPKKRNDLSTVEGVRNVESELDDVYGIIEEKIAAGRGVDAEVIKANYGQGSMMTARTALKNGMIDSIGSTNIKNKINKTSGISGQKKESKMETLAELKASHPDLYATCFNTGVEAGKKEFKAFASGHIKLAEASGDNKRAMEDIAAMNDPRDVECTIHHQSVAIKKAQIVARDGEAPPEIGEGEGDNPLANASNKSDDKKETEEAQALFAKLGVEVE